MIQKFYNLGDWSLIIHKDRAILSSINFCSISQSNVAALKNNTGYPKSQKDGSSVFDQSKTKLFFNCQRTFHGLSQSLIRLSPKELLTLKLNHRITLRHLWYFYFETMITKSNDLADNAFSKFLGFGQPLAVEASTTIAAVLAVKWLLWMAHNYQLVHETTPHQLQ